MNKYLKDLIEAQDPRAKQIAIRKADLETKIKKLKKERKKKCKPLNDLNDQIRCYGKFNGMIADADTEIMRLS